MSFLDGLFGPPNVEKLKAKGDVDGLIRVMIEYENRNYDDENYNKYRSVREAAAKALREIEDKRAVEPLIVALKNSNSRVRQAAAEALGKIGDKRAVESLIVALEDRDVHCSAIEALGKIRDNRAVKPLIVLLKDENTARKAAVAEALGKIEDDRAVKPLIVALKDSNSRVRQAAAEALMKIGTSSVEPLIVALKDRDSDVREAAAEALMKIGDKRAVESLIATLKDSRISVREYAAEALMKIGTSSVEPLIVALKDSDSGVRMYAAKALMKIGDKRAVISLIAALKDSDSDVRKYAAIAIGEFGDNRAVEPLIAVLKDSDSVRKVAAEALDKIGWKPDRSKSGIAYYLAKGEWNECVKLGASAILPLIPLLKDSDSDVRKHAAEALEEIGWKPDKSENGVAFLTIKAENLKGEGRWDEYVRIGAPSLKPLINQLGMSTNWLDRKRAANALILIYKNGKLDDSQKRLLLAERDKIIEEHHDYIHSPNCKHDEHYDKGIGVNFPI